MTPYSFAQRVLPAGTRVLFLSASGSHHDIVRTALLGIERGYEVRAAVCQANSPLAEVVRSASHEDAVFVMGEPTHADDLIPVQTVVAFAVLGARTYGGHGPWAPCFDGPGADLPVRVPRFAVAFGAGAAEPAAVDFVNKCQETGLVPAWHTDVRHFAHGQFMMLRAAGDDILLIGFATRPQRDYLERFAAALPPGVRLHRVEVDSDGASAALSLLARAMRSFESIATAGGGPPTLATLPHWGRRVYELEP
jgi:hypothetical protein